MSSTETSLASWRDTATTQAIRDFVAAATREGDRGCVPPPERLAVFDNDGTLWTSTDLDIQTADTSTSSGVSARVPIAATIDEALAHEADGGRAPGS